METKKFNQWLDLLLDTGKRNNLVNFKDTKTSTVEIIFPSSDILFEKIESASSLEIFDPKIGDKSESFVSNNSDRFLIEDNVGKDQLSKDDFFDRYANRIKRKNQILVYSTSGNPISSIRKIGKKARTIIEETGVNVVYMAFGFIHWNEGDHSKVDFHAPVLLVPIKLQQDSAIQPYYIKLLEDDVIINPTFAYKIDSEYGIKFPEYNDEGLRAYLATIQSIVDKLQWTVTEECKIGIFSFQKINMYHDLKNNQETILMNKNVRQLLGEYNPTPDEDTIIPKCNENAYDEFHCVVDADSSQLEAVMMAQSGKSFVLQGPPGTGKSQTITNIIAESLYEGKKILFVSEKLAALNVVYEKLKQVGLSDFCLPLHSHKTAKKEVIADICNTLRSPKVTLSSKVNSEVATKEKCKEQLDLYVLELHKCRPIIDKSLYELYEAYFSLRLEPDVEWVISQIDSKDDTFLVEVTLLLEQFADYVPVIGKDYKKNPWYGYSNQDTSYQTKSDLKKAITAIIILLQNLIPIAKEIAEKYGVVCNSIEDAFVLKDFFNLLLSSQVITPSLLHKENFEVVNSNILKIQNLCIEILDLRSILNSYFDEDIYKLDGNLYYKKLTKQFTGIISRLFNTEYKKLMADLRLCKKDGKRVTYEEAIKITKQLDCYQSKYEEYCEIENLIKSYLGNGYKGLDTDWNSLLNEINILNNILLRKYDFNKLAEYSSFDNEKVFFGNCVQALSVIQSSCDKIYIDFLSNCFNISILNVKTLSLSILLSRLKDCFDELDKIDNWCNFVRILSMLEEKDIIDYISTYMEQNLDYVHIASAFKKLFYYQWIDYIISNNEILSTFNRISQDKMVESFKEKDLIQFEINKALIRSEVSSKRPSLEMLSSGSSVALLLREGEKKRRQKSIRLLLQETGDIVQRVKPCFMMSPLSVSTFLGSNSVSFDIVIFDEASQVFPQDAIGAIYRAKQMIVVGDSKQMPPSNFFNSVLDINEDEVEDTTDFESILELCSTCMRQLRLRWHYRSRYEQLITFSNKNFYENELVTFPSPKPNVPSAGLDYFHVDGIFDRKSHTNYAEALYVVDLIYQNIDKYPDRSLGVIAFSVAQQDLIDKLLSKKRQSLPEKEFFFNDDGKEPFFIKNLETVQGDERDTIIFSIAYGMDAQRRFIHNFGPLNRVGGERRLNVAITRAKYNIQLVSSMHYTDIDLKRTASVGVKLLKEYLEFAETNRISLDYVKNKNCFEMEDSDFKLEVCEFLRSKGFQVDVDIGYSDFKIDLGVKSADGSGYVLAIESDGTIYRSLKNTRDRDRLRQEILERMGWKYCRVWSTEWFRNKVVEQSRLLEIVVEASKQENNFKNSKSLVVSAESFEESYSEVILDFPVYKVADIRKLSTQYLPDDFQGMIKEILRVEAPLSEELLLKRIVPYFGREKVTHVVQGAYLMLMDGCQSCGIVRRNGFLYLNDDREILFRIPGDIVREIKQIAPEELAKGMLDILQVLGTVDKQGLYVFLARKCGVTRISKLVSELFDEALFMLNDYITITGDLLSLN